MERRKSQAIKAYEKFMKEVVNANEIPDRITHRILTAFIEKQDTVIGDISIIIIKSDDKRLFVTINDTRNEEGFLYSEKMTEDDYEYILNNLQRRLRNYEYTLILNSGLKYTVILDRETNVTDMLRYSADKDIFEFIMIDENDKEYKMIVKSNSIAALIKL